MHAWLDWGLPLILGLQGLGAWLEAPMRLLSFLGSEPFFLLVLPGVLWCLDADLGLQAGLVLMASVSLNGVLKLVFGWPRPYWVASGVRALAVEGSYGMPSGHAQNTLALFGRLAAGLGRRGWALAVGLVILLVGLSRMVLGVHFPTDVLGGWLAAGLLLAAFMRLEGPVGRWMSRLPLAGQLLVPLAASALLLGLGLAAATATASRGVPQAWVLAAAAAAPGSAPIDPQNAGDMLASAGTLFGLGAGGVLLRRWGHFSAAGVLWKRLARFAVGVVGVALIYFGLRAILPAGDGALPQTLRYLRYAAVGLWVAYAGPWVFVRLGLA